MSLRLTALCPHSTQIRIVEQSELEPWKPRLIESSVVTIVSPLELIPGIVTMPSLEGSSCGQPYGQGAFPLGKGATMIRGMEVLLPCQHSWYLWNVIV
jgi:hypothetical protein